MEHLKSLQKLGLNSKEQDIYFAILELEKATANQIAYKAKIKRPTAYDILYHLKQNGFIAETREDKKRYFIANSPRKIIELIEEQKREIKTDLPFLLSIFNSQSKKPKIAYFEGKEGIIQLYEDTLEILKKRDEILAYVTSETPEFMPEYTAEYVKRRAQKGIILRGIYNDSPKIREYLKNNKAQLRTARIIDQEKFHFKNEINIYANKVIIIAYSPEPFGILIESQEIADSQRTIFELAWRGAK